MFLHGVVPVVVQDVGTGAAVAVDSNGWSDCIVWNPHLTMKVSLLGTGHVVES